MGGWSKEKQREYRQWLKGFGLNSRKLPYVTKAPGSAERARKRKQEMDRANVARRVASGENAEAQRAWKSARKADGFLRVRFDGVERWVKMLPGGRDNTRAMLLDARRRRLRNEGRRMRRRRHGS